MNRLPPLAVEEADSILAEIGTLMADPKSIAVSLQQRGYTSRAFAGGVLAVPLGPAPEVLVAAPLHGPARCSMSGLFASGRHVARCGAIVAALRATSIVSPDHLPALLFSAVPVAETQQLPGRVVLGLEGGVSPRIWPNCFGSVDFLIRCIGRQPQHAMPNMAVNALEAAVPIMSALQAASAFPPGRRRNSGSPDAPLSPRLSLLAAHGGTRGASPPTLFDIVVTRRYGPDESIDTVTAEVDAVVRGATAPNLRVEVSVLGHTAPVEDPTRPRWPLETEALAVGWKWPQTAFRTQPPLIANGILFGGLEDESEDPGLPTAFVSVEEVAALTKSLVIYLSAA